MIETVLVFTIGFLCAGFLALMIAPMIWRRAVKLTRKKIEASVPLSLNEIQADKDRMRAEFAMSTRRLDMSVKNFRDKVASQIVEINRNREAIAELGTERDKKSAALSEMENQAADLRKDLMRREQQLEEMQERIALAEVRLEERALELERMGRKYDELSVTSSNRQVELVANETQIERLAGDVEGLRTARRSAESRMREVEREAKDADAKAADAVRKLASAERKMERLVASLADREEKLDRRDKEVAKLREELKDLRKSSNDATKQMAAAEKEKIRLEADMADLSLQMSTLLTDARGGDVEKAMETLHKERKRADEARKTAEQEAKSLRKQLTAHERSSGEGWDDYKRENALLREQINDLAAEVVRMTAMIEGPESPINAILDAAPKEAKGRKSAKEPTSLADRVKALQEAASAKAV